MNIYLYEKNGPIEESIKNIPNKDHKLKKVIKDQETLTNIINGEEIDILIVNITEIDKELADKIKSIPYLITTASDTSINSFQKALELNVKAFLSLPLQENEYNNTLKKAEKYVQESELKRQRNAKVITLLSSKGGVGKSALTANIAMYLQQISKKKVLVIDTVARYGNIDLLFDVGEKKSLEFIPNNIDNYETFIQEIEGNTIVHPSGIHLLKAGEETLEGAPLNKLKSIINTIKTKYDFVLVDTESCFNDVNLALLELSELILFVSTFDIPSVKNLNLGLETIKALYFSTEKIKIIINRYNQSSDLNVADIETFLKNKISAIIPEKTEVVAEAANKGVPFIIENPPDDLLKAIKSTVNLIIGKKVAAENETADQALEGISWLSNLKNFFAEKKDVTAR